MGQTAGKIRRRGKRGDSGPVARYETALTRPYLQIAAPAILRLAGAQSFPCHYWNNFTNQSICYIIFSKQPFLLGGKALRKTLFLRGSAVLSLLLIGLWASASGRCHQTDRPAPPRLSSSASELPVEISVDPRVELFSIIFRLAGNPEYDQGRIDSYTREVERQFAAYRNHPAVVYASQLRASRGVGYDAPMGLAVYLKPGFSLQEAFPLNTFPADLDRRWTPANTREFLNRARQFSRDTNFEVFFNRQQPRYRQAIEAMRQLLAEKNRLGWFTSFFGTKASPDFHLMLGMLNGGCCYGPRAKIGEAEGIYCILGVWQQNPGGGAQFDQEAIYTIVHEFAHSYANPLVDRHLAELRPAGERLFGKVKNQMARQAYGNWETMMRESLVRACVVRYASDIDGPDAAEKRARDEAARGFTWTKSLARLLGEYEADRETYPDLEAFFPKIVTFFNEYASEK
jgi:hypothetical protein